VARIQVAKLREGIRSGRSRSAVAAEGEFGKRLTRPLAESHPTAGCIQEIQPGSSDQPCNLVAREAREREAPEQTGHARGIGPASRWPQARREAPRAHARPAGPVRRADGVARDDEPARPPTAGRRSSAATTPAQAATRRRGPGNANPADRPRDPWSSDRPGGRESPSRTQTQCECGADRDIGCQPQQMGTMASRQPLERVQTDPKRVGRRLRGDPGSPDPIGCALSRP
jgi:hypothetical protein